MKLRKIKRLADKVRDGKISLDEMIGGTFTITNGGVFGSMLSTPIINPPQSAILGMHNVTERPTVINNNAFYHVFSFIHDHELLMVKIQ